MLVRGDGDSRYAEFYFRILSREQTYPCLYLGIHYLLVHTIVDCDKYQATGRFVC